MDTSYDCQNSWLPEASRCSVGAAPHRAAPRRGLHSLCLLETRSSNPGWEPRSIGTRRADQTAGRPSSPDVFGHARTACRSGWLEELGKFRVGAPGPLPAERQRHSNTSFHEGERVGPRPAPPHTSIAHGAGAGRVAATARIVPALLPHCSAGSSQALSRNRLLFSSDLVYSSWLPWPPGPLDPWAPGPLDPLATQAPFF